MPCWQALVHGLDGKSFINFNGAQVSLMTQRLGGGKQLV